MQFFVLFIGAMVFVFYVFVEPPVLFQHTELARITQSSEYTGVETRYHEAFERRREAALALAEAHRAGDGAARTKPSPATAPAGSLRMCRRVGQFMPPDQPVFAAFSASHHHTAGNAARPYFGIVSGWPKRFHRAVRTYG